MPSFRCDNCNGIRYPHNMKFQNCIACGDRCARDKEDASISREYADFLLIKAQRVLEFEQWCEENARRPEDLPGVFLELPDGHDSEAREYAMGVAWMVEDAFPTYCLGELYVFWP